MYYIEYSASAGPGTLVRHGVEAFNNDPGVASYIEHEVGIELCAREIITSERYQEFISIHGGERAC